MLKRCTTTTPVRPGRSAMPATHSRTDAYSSRQPSSIPRTLCSRRIDRRPGSARGGPVWIVDPLDGARESPSPDATTGPCTSRSGNTPTRAWPAGAVALPAVGIVLSTTEAARVAAGHRLPPSSHGQPSARTGRSHTTASRRHARRRRRLPRLRRREGHGGRARPRRTAYVHSGGQYEWDSATPAAVAPTRPGCTRHASTDRRSSTTDRARGSPTWSCAGRSWPTRC